MAYVYLQLSSFKAGKPVGKGNKPEVIGHKFPCLRAVERYICREHGRTLCLVFIEIHIVAVAVGVAFCKKLADYPCTARYILRIERTCIYFISESTRTAAEIEIRIHDIVCLLFLYGKIYLDGFAVHKQRGIIHAVFAQIQNISRSIGAVERSLYQVGGLFRIADMQSPSEGD